MITIVAEQPAEFGDYSPCALIVTHGDISIAKLPLDAFADVDRWLRTPDAPPMRCRDSFGQLLSITRDTVGYVIQRDLHACVALEAKDRQAAAQRVVE